MKLNKSLVTSTLATLMLTGTAAYAGPSSLSVSGKIESDFSHTTGSDSVESRVNAAEIKATLALREGLKAVLLFDLGSAANGSFDKDDLEKMIEEAYIEVDANGYATILVGKHQMAFAQELANMAIPENDQRYALANEDEMIGITVKLPQETLGVIGQVIDTLEVSAFETGAGDLDVSSNAGVSFRATKAFSEKIQAAVSALMKQQDGADDETRVAVSMTYAADNGWTFYAEGQWMDNNPTYPDAAYAVTVGGSKAVGPGTLVLQASYVENNGEELGASYHLPISQNVTLSPEIRYNTETKDTTIAARVTIQGTVHKDLSGQMPDPDQR